MTKETLRRLHEHLKKLSKADADNINFDTKFSKVDMTEGIPKERVALINSDATSALEEMEKKHPFLTGKEKTEEEKTILDKIADNKKDKK